MHIYWAFKVLTVEKWFGLVFGLRKTLYKYNYKWLKNIWHFYSCIKCIYFKFMEKNSGPLSAILQEQTILYLWVHNNLVFLWKPTSDRECHLNIVTLWVNSWSSSTPSGLLISQLWSGHKHHSMQIYKTRALKGFCQLKIKQWRIQKRELAYFRHEHDQCLAYTIETCSCWADMLIISSRIYKSISYATKFNFHWRFKHKCRAVLNAPCWWDTPSCAQEG